MAEFLGNCWSILTMMYQIAYASGLMGCVIIFAVAVIASKAGVKLTGRDESFTGTINNGHADLRRNPAIEGTAKTWIGRFWGTLLQLAGSITIVVTLIAAANLFLDGNY